MKGISCLVVIFLHIPFPGIIGDAIIYGLRFSVPIFFMISGYVCYFRDLKWIKTSCLKILKLLLISEVVCGLIKFIFCDGTVLEQINSMRIWNHPISTLMFGTLFNDSLWYLYAMIYTWICVYFLKKKDVLKKAYILIPILLTLHIVGRLVVQQYGDINEWVMCFRSWILYGLPFVLLGHYLAEREKSKGFTNRACALLLAAGVAAMLAEFFIWRSYMDIWGSTVLVSLALFLFALINPDSSVVPPLAKMGKRYSKIIYVSHIPIAIIFDEVLKQHLAGMVYDWIKPSLVLIGSLAVAVIAERIMSVRRSRMPM